MSQQQFSLVDELAGPEPESQEAEPTAQAPEPPSKPAEESKPDENAIKAENLQNALHEARMQVKEAKEAQDKLRAEMEDREARMAQYVKDRFDELRRPQPQEPAAPNPQDDPLGYAHWENEQLRKRVDALEGANQQTQQATHEQEQVVKLRQHLANYEYPFMEQQPDYPQALAYAQQHARMLLEAQGFPPGEIERHVTNWGLQFGAMKLQQRENPAEAMYALAEKLGYQKSSKEPEPGKGDSKAEPSPLDAIEKGQKQSGLGTGADVIVDDKPSDGDEFPLLREAMREIGLA